MTAGGSAQRSTKAMGIEGRGGNTPVFGRERRRDGSHQGTPRTHSGPRETRELARDMHPRRLFNENNSLLESLPDEAEVSTIMTALTPQSTPEGTHRCMRSLQRNQTGRLLQSNERLLPYQERAACRAPPASGKAQGTTSSPRRGASSKKENISPRKNGSSENENVRPDVQHHHLEKEVKDLREQLAMAHKKLDDQAKESQESKEQLKAVLALLPELIKSTQVGAPDREGTDQSDRADRPLQPSGSQCSQAQSSACSTPRSSGRVRVRPPTASSHPSLTSPRLQGAQRPYPQVNPDLYARREATVPLMGGSQCVMQTQMPVRPTRRAPTPTSAQRAVAHKSASPTRTPLGRMQISPRMARMGPASRSASAGTWESGDVEEGGRALYPRNDRAQPSYEGIGMTKWRRGSPCQRHVTSC
mmetsp:Transcript_8289/g.19496  ORF Transcript_8289/g.19496 Transcript_8289/m.19496 type:complete len:417 (+) Transcript_8289:46-1296(+)